MGNPLLRTVAAVRLLGVLLLLLLLFLVIASFFGISQTIIVCVTVG